VNWRSNQGYGIRFPKKFLSYKFCDQANLFKFYVILIEEVSSHEAKERQAYDNFFTFDKSKIFQK